MREGFKNPDDVSAIFVCQPFRWSHLDRIAQNSFFIGRKEELIKGWDNTIWIGADGRREIDSFPGMADGVEAYSPGTEYDIGPGIKNYLDNDTYTYVRGDATNAYEKDELEKFTREIVYLKPAIFVIYDQVITRQAGLKKSWIIHPGADPLAIGDSLVLIKNGSSALWVKRLLPEQVKQNLDSSLIRVSPVKSTQKDLFLYVMQVTGSNVSSGSPELVADQANLILGINRTGVHIDRWEVIFNDQDPNGVTVSETVKKRP